MTEKDLIRMLTEAYELGRAHGAEAEQDATKVRQRVNEWASCKVNRAKEYNELVTL